MPCLLWKLQTSQNKIQGHIQLLPTNIYLLLSQTDPRTCLHKIRQARTRTVPQSNTIWRLTWDSALVQFSVSAAQHSSMYNSFSVRTPFHSHWLGCSSWPWCLCRKGRKLTVSFCNVSSGSKGGKMTMVMAKSGECHEFHNFWVWFKSYQYFQNGESDGGEGISSLQLSVYHYIISYQIGLLIQRFARLLHCQSKYFSWPVWRASLQTSMKQRAMMPGNTELCR